MKSPAGMHFMSSGALAHSAGTSGSASTIFASEIPQTSRMTDSRFIVEPTMMKVALSSSALALVVSLSSPARADLAPLSDDQVATLKSPGDEPLEAEITLSYPRT